MKIIKFIVIFILITFSLSRKRTSNRSADIPDPKITNKETGAITTKSPGNNPKYGVLESIKKHNLNCSAIGAMSNFHMVREEPHSVNFKYGCVAYKGISNEIKALNTNFEKYSDDQYCNNCLIKLSGHNVACPTGYAIKQWNTETKIGWNIRYNYTCAKINYTKCTTYKTDKIYLKEDPLKASSKEKGRLYRLNEVNIGN